jgi:hypothetical protein
MMKKITLFLMLLTVTFGYSQTLPFDFEGTLHDFTGDSGASVSAKDDSGNQVLEIVGNGTNWDNAQVTFASVLDLSDSNENTIKFRMKAPGSAAGAVHEHILKFELPSAGSDLEVRFTTTGSDWQNIEVDMDNGNTTPTSYGKMVIMVDAGGGPTASTVATYLVDDINIGQTTTGTDASLSDLTVGGTTITGFDTATTSYTVEVAKGTTEVPAVTATTTDAGASTIVSAAGSLPGVTSVEVVAANGTTKKTYTVSFKYPIIFPFDFEGSSTNWIGDNSTVSLTDNSELSIIGNGTDWDNAQVTFTSPVDLSDDANNTLRFTFQSTTAADGEIHQHGISFQETADGAGGSYEVNFQTTGKEVANIELDFGAGLGTSKKFVIFTDVGDLGAVKATPNVNGLADAGKKLGTYIVDNITLGATVLSIKNNSVLDFSMYPNPTFNMLNISAKETIQDTQIFNVLGKNVMSVKVNNSKASIDVSNLATGIYLVKYSVNGTIGTAKFVKK